MEKIQKIKFEHFTWVNIENPTELELDYLRENYQFHPLDLQDCLSTIHRTKIDTYDSYTFLVLLFPVFDYQSREISAAEIDVFIGKKFFITIHRSNIPVFQDFFKLYSLSGDLREKHNTESPEPLFYEMLNKIFGSLFPMVDHLSQDCDNIERAIFAGRERKMVSEILIIRRNIIDTRKIMQSHKNVIKKTILFFKENSHFVMKKTDIYFENILDYTKEIWESLENLKERIEALQETNESQISFRMSDIMRILTIISVITFPITLIAAIFGMNTVNSMPFINNRYGFWVIIAIMVSLITFMLSTFKKKGWM